MKPVFIDCETTGLMPAYHEPWEVAIITGAGAEHEWRWMPRLARADPMALAMNGFYDRTADLVEHGDSALVSYMGPDGSAPVWVSRARAAMGIARLTVNAELHGANPAFDAAMLAPWLAANGAVAAWHYRVVCVETLVAGLYGMRAPWSSADLSRRVGVDPDGFDRHSARGDARWVRAMYQAWLAAAAMMSPRPSDTTEGKAAAPSEGDEAARREPMDPGEPAPVPPPPKPARAASPELAQEKPAPAPAEKPAEGADLMGPDWPRPGGSWRCHECGGPIVDQSGQPDVKQAQVSFSVFEHLGRGVTLCRRCHIARATVTSG